jgi:hypothetical protein
LFTTTKMEEEARNSVDPTIGVWNVLTTPWSTPALFKNLTNFNATKFEDLASIVVPTIIFHAWSIGKTPIVSGRRSKLNPKQHFLNFVFFLKHDNVTKYNYFHVELGQKLGVWCSFHLILH